MENPNFNNWSREEKEKYAQMRLDEMRVKNQKLEKRHAEVQGDKMKAENENCSITNLNRRQDRLAEGSRSRLTTRPVPSSTREWDRGKNINDDWGSHSHKGFKSYKTGSCDKRNRNDSWPKEEKNFQRRPENTFDKKTRRSDQHNRSRYYDNSYKYGKNSQYQASYSYGRTQHATKNSYQPKRYYPTDSRKKHNKYHSSSSADSRKIGRKERSSQSSVIWNEKLDDADDVDKSEQTKIWVDSVCNSTLEQENVSGEEKVNKKSPKRKCDRFETESDKCLNEISAPFPKSKSLQISISKSQKYEYYEKKASNQGSGENKREYQKKHSTERRCTKFDRYDHSEESSNESNSLSRWCNVPEKKMEDSSFSLSSIKQDSNERRNSYEVKNERKNIQSNISFHGNRSNSVDPSDFPSKSSPHKTLPHHVENYNAGNNYDKKIYKKGFKTKRDPQCNSPDGCKNKHFTKQRRYDKFQNDSISQHSDLKSGKSDKSKTGDKIDGDIKENNNYADDCWNSTSQSGAKWNFSSDEEKKEADCYENVKSAEKLKGKNPVAYDEGGWSTVEEGEIKSGDSGEDSDHVKPKIH